MDFAIAAVRRAELRPGVPQPDPDGEWAVLCLQRRRGQEVAQHLAQFGHRTHAEAFLADLLAGWPASAPGAAP